MDNLIREFDVSLIKKNWKHSVSYDIMADAIISTRSTFRRQVTTTSISFKPKQHLGLFYFLSYFRLIEEDQIPIYLNNTINSSVRIADTNDYPGIVYLSIFFGLMAILYHEVADNFARYFFIASFFLLSLLLIVAMVRGKRRYLINLFQNANHLNSFAYTSQDKQCMDEFRNLCLVCELEEKSFLSFIFESGNIGYFIYFMCVFVLFAILYIAIGIGFI